MRSFTNLPPLTPMLLVTAHKIMTSSMSFIKQAAVKKNLLQKTSKKEKVVFNKRVS